MRNLCLFGDHEKMKKIDKTNAVHADQYIHYATNSNRVPNSAGTRPVMQLPAEFPNDVHHAYYIAEAKKLLGEVGC